jgi:chemotaxis signal transduction protein
MSDRSDELRQLFDRDFAEPPAPDKPATLDYLRIRVDGEPFAVALAEVSSFHTDLRVVPMPSPARELLGIAAVRAALVPIYDLRLAIGASASRAARWSILVRGGTAGFSFDGFDGHARTTTRIAVEAGGVRPLVTLDGHAYPVIAVETLLETLQRKETR